MAINYTPLTNGQFATAAIFNAPLTELDNAIEHLGDGSKAMSTPSIGSFTNAQHTHQNAAAGGQLDAAAIGTGTFNTARIPTLDASKIGTGIFNNALINWAAPGALGGTTPSTGKFTGITVAQTSSNTLVNINANAGTTRGTLINTGTSARWLIYGTSVAESGSNVGTDFAIARHNDAGTFVANSLSITRANGNAALEANLNVVGTLSKGAGSFFIDHPLDPLNRNLVHSFIEGPRADLVYRGTVRLSNGQGQASIDQASGMTPGTFEVLTRHQDAVVWLQNQSGFEPVRGRVVGGMVEIECQNPASSDLVAWLVIAERNDGYYRYCDLTDERGQFLVETTKPLPTADELRELEPIEADVDQVTTQVVTALLGRQGYALHAVALGLPLPLREVRPIQRGGVIDLENRSSAS